MNDIILSIKSSKSSLWVVLPLRKCQFVLMTTMWLVSNAWDCVGLKSFIRFAKYLSLLEGSELQTCSCPGIHHFIQVAKIVKICKRIKSKRLKGSNRSPGSPFDNISFTRVKKLLIILQVRIENHPVSRKTCFF